MSTTCTSKYIARRVGCPETGYMYVLNILTLEMTFSDSSQSHANPFPQYFLSACVCSVWLLVLPMPGYDVVHELYVHRKVSPERPTLILQPREENCMAECY